MYAQRLNKLCQMEVREAKNGDQIRPGLVLIAPGSQQMEVVRSANGGYAVRCFSGQKVSGHMPSVDVLFRSVAKNVVGNKIGIIMTGMGKDGAEGLLEMRKKERSRSGRTKPPAWSTECRWLPTDIRSGIYRQAANRSRPYC